MFHDAMISAVIPCYNEEEGLKRVIPYLPDIIDEVIVVDNNSSDDTANVARSLGAIVIPEKRQGYGRAYKAGLPKANGDVIVTLDGDGTYPTQVIPFLINGLFTAKLDFVSASRTPAKLTNANEIIRYSGSLGLSFAVFLLFGITLKDSQSGMWVFRRRMLGALDVGSNDMAFSQEIKIRAFLENRFRSKEIPIHFNYSARIGKSKLNPWRDGYKNLRHLIKLRCALARVS